MDEKQVKIQPFKADILINKYIEHLERSRGLSQKHSRENARQAHIFLRETFGTQMIRTDQIRPEHVREFILSYANNKGANAGQRMVSALRSFFRFLKQAELAINLVNYLPAVPFWKRSSYPVTLSLEEINQLLAGVNRKTSIGMRDYAILVLLARLGLRSCELCSLSLEDFDWLNGEILVYGKGREHKLPMSQEVGESLISYLRYGRPICGEKFFFVSENLPIRGLSSSTLRTIVNSALKRAGLNPSRKGPNLLRHSLATELLKQGATLDEIAMVLGHKYISTTSTYIAVNIEELRILALPWPLKLGGVK